MPRGCARELKEIGLSAKWVVMLLFVLAGCSSTSQTKSQSSNCVAGSDGTTATCRVTNTEQQQSASLSDFSGAASSASVAAYRLILSAPSDAALNTQSPVQATLSATTDRGYTSTVTVTLQLTTSTTQPAAPGDTVYTFLFPSTSTVTNWGAAVQANTNSNRKCNGNQYCGF